MIPAFLILAYLVVVLYIGIFASRRGRPGAEDYFLAGRSLGPTVFLLSLVGTNMTAFSILGASGFSFTNGIVTFGLMASSSALIIPLTLFFIGPRIWALGKRHGFMTPVQMFRDRWDCRHIGTVIAAVQAALLIPYIVIGVMGGGATLYAISGGFVPYWLGGATVALVVMSYVFFGGMRGTAWVNAFQTTLFLIFGAVAVGVIGVGMGGYWNASEAMLDSVWLAPLMTREKVSALVFFSYTFIPLSTIAFPHITIFCLTARRVTQFKRTVILYPLCILIIWLPSVFLGVMANKATDIPAIKAKVEARQTLVSDGALVSSETRGQLVAESRGDDVIILMLEHYAPLWLAGLLGAAIMAAVMASDSQILALSTLFTEDIFAYYGGKERFGEKVQVRTGRIFVIVITALAYVIAIQMPASIFAIASQYAFSGYAALAPLMLAALFWKGSTKWGALASTLWTALAVLAVAVFQTTVAPPATGQVVVWSAFGLDLVSRMSGGTAVLGFLPVVPMTIVSTLLLVVVSSVTAKPKPSVLRRYFSV